MYPRKPSRIIEQVSCDVSFDDDGPAEYTYTVIGDGLSPEGIHDGAVNDNPRWGRRLIGRVWRVDSPFDDAPVQYGYTVIGEGLPPEGIIVGMDDTFPVTQPLPPRDRQCKQCPSGSKFFVLGKDVRQWPWGG